MRAEERREKEEATGADLDPQMEQEIADLDDLDDEEHPDYYHIDPDQLDNNPPGEVKSRKVFKAIALPSKDAQVFDLIITTTAGANVNFLLKHRILRQDHSKPHSVAEKIFHFFAA